tara:strand:- start:368 stop:688 length:321 start_codon:yes stop_codon:yes gene_type:complete
MEYNFEGNTTTCSVTYFRNRIGPNFFRIYYKQGCYIRFDPVEVGRVFGVAKFTPWVNKMREWAKEMVATYDKSAKEDLDKDRITKEGFGPEAHIDEDPTANTKMIV